MTCKELNGMDPKSISHLVTLKPLSAFGIRSNNRHLLTVLPERTLATVRDRVFAAGAAKLWNSLTFAIKI